jgi:hypothetical protein
LSPPKLPMAAYVLAAAALLASAYQEPAPDNAAGSTRSFIGERLVYKIRWDPPWYLFFLPTMEAGEAELQLSRETEFNGRKTLEIRFKAHSSGTLVRMAGVKIEDEFAFFTDPETFCTLGTSAKIREGKRKRQIEVQYFPETRRLHIREMDESTVPPKLKKDETKSDIPECVHDPFSALYLFRSSPLRDQYTRDFTLANYDKIKEVQAKVEKREIIQGPSGKVAAWKVSTVSLMGGLFKEGGQFKIWLTADDRKVPVQFEVKVHLGHILGKLID